MLELALLFLGIVLLYRFTRDRWNWGRIVHRLSVGALSLGIGSIVLLGAVLVKTEWLDERPRIITDFQGVSLSDKLSDLFFKHGDFKKVVPKEAVEKHYGKDRYENEKKRLTVTVKHGVVELIQYRCASDQMDYDEINGISCGDSGEDILKKFGKKARILCLKQQSEYGKFVRVYDVVEYGTRYALVMNQVHSIAIAAPKDLESFIRKGWDKCE